MRFSGRFQEQFETYACQLEIEVDGHIQRQTIEAPRMFIEQQFLSLVGQAASSAQPVRIRLSRTEQIWSQYDQRHLPQEYDLEFTNNAYEYAHKEGA